MWKHQGASNLLAHLFLIFVLSAHLETARALSGKRLCVDEHCKGIISMGHGTINYRAGEEGMVSFMANSAIRILSKGLGTKSSIWGIEVNGRKGDAPKMYIRETNIVVGATNLIEVDDELETETPVLSTSEKSVEQGTTPEATSTKPLNRTPTGSSEDLLNKNSNEKISAENLPVATPVVTKIVDGTKVEVLGNSENGNENKSENKEPSSSNIPDENKKDNEDIAEAETKLETIREPEEYKNYEEETSKVKSNERANAKEENVANFKETNSANEYIIEENISKLESGLASETNKTNKIESEKEEQFLHSNETANANVSVEKGESVISKQQIKKDEVNVNEERKQTEHQEDGFKSEENISNTTAEFNKAIEVETEKPKAPNVDSEISVGVDNSVNENSFISNDPAEKNQKANIPDNNKNAETKPETDIEVEKSKENTSKQTSNLVSEIPVGEYASANQSDFKGGNLAGRDQNDNDKIPINKDNMENNAALKEHYTSSSAIALDQELSNNSVDNLNNEFNNTHIESSLASETNQTKKLNSEKEEQPNQTFNETSIMPSKIYNETVKTGYSSDNSSESNAEVPKYEPQKNDETIVNTEELQYTTEKIETKEYNPTETHLSTKDIERNTKEIDSPKISPYAASENSKTDDRANNEKHVGESSSTLREDINSEVDEDVSLQQSKEYTAKQIDNTNSYPTESVPYYKEPTKTETVKTEPSTETDIDRTEKISNNSVSNTEESFSNTIYQTSPEMQSQAEVTENINPTTSNPIDDIPLNTPLPTYQEDITTSVPQIDNHVQHFEHSQESTPTTIVNGDVQLDEKKDDSTKAAPALDILESKENKGLFATIMGTVNNMLTNNRKKQNEFDGNNELDKILFSQGNAQKNNYEQTNEETSFPYCKNIEPNGDCPESSENHDHSTSQLHHTASKSLLGSGLTMETFLTSMASKILEMSQLIAFLGIAAAASLFFIFGYYCFCNSSREGALLLKLNQLESSLLASHKENAILKHNLMSTRQKLASIEDNSFGSNDMVVSLKKELEEELLDKARLQEQITVLQKELENAADAGIELNKIVSELLSNQTGDESIISSVEELQKQLNEQQNTIYEINASLAEKSRENSELQLMIAEQNARYEAELANVQRDNDELEHEKGNLLTRLEEMKTDFDKDITVALEGKNMEIKRLQNDILDLNNKLENEHRKWQTSVAKIEALEECLKNVRKDPKVNISEVIDVANVKAQLIEGQKMYKSLKERFETELDSRKLVENQLQVVSAEVEKLKQDFNQSEKDKLEAQTRLEVLSNYFKDKENQLQKELSLKEAMWLKQQGETTTTVDRVTAMQEEIQSLKSQNDSLRAEIEAQLAAHKAQIGTLENRAHETWLAARQSDRRYEEARAEATALRRKLTALAGGTVNESIKPSAGPAVLGDELTQAPSPIHMESPGSPMLGRMPPPPPFLPPPFMGPPPPFMGMPPPPPFVPPGEMRPAPLGRIMSPPPQRSGRFSPQHLDYEDYLDYEGNNTWQRYTYSPPPRTYRSLSPTDSRYNYGTERDLMSTYDTETDFSPPPSPRESRRRVGNSSERIDSNTKISYGNTKKLNSSNKGPLSSGSENSFNTHSHSDTKTKKGNASVGGGKNLV